MPFDVKTGIHSSSLGDVHYPLLSTYQTVFNKGNLHYPYKVALIDGATGEEVTYQELFNSTNAVSAYLGRFGLKRAEVIAVFSPNHIQYPMILFAGVRGGNPMTLANPGYTANEFAFQLQDSGAKVIFVHPDVLQTCYEAARLSNIPKSNIFVLGKQDVHSHLCVKSIIDLGKGYISSYPPVQYSDDQLLNDAAYLCYSSGTTGRSKGVISTNRNLVSNMFQYEAMEFPTNPSVVNLAVLPFYHIYAVMINLHAALWRSETIVVMTKFALPDFLDLIQKYQVSHINLVPPIALGMAKSPIVDNYNLSSLKAILSGAAPLSPDLTKEFNARFSKLGFVIKQAYGLTETSPLALYSFKDNIVIGSVGLLAPNMTAKVLSPEGKLLGYGEEGELCLKGPNVMRGYLNNDKATNESILDGFFHTGDIVVASEDGHFKILDRLKELIKYKGLQVVPAELEGYLLGHPKIADAAVIPIPDERCGELPKAYVVLKPGVTASEKEIQAFIEAKVSQHKRLRGGVEFINEIPKSASGKILRRILRDLNKAPASAKL